MDFFVQYRKKLRIPEAVQAVKSGDRMDYTVSLGFPILLDGEPANAGTSWPT